MNKALVISATRKYLKILTKENKILNGVLTSKDLSALVGDNVLYSQENEEALIYRVEERKNILKRATESKSKELLANIDLVTIITAPRPLFNRSFIDRVIATAMSQNIDVLLVVNKNDLSSELDEIKDEINIYKKIGINVINSNTKEDNGLNNLKQEFQSIDSGIICLLGVSGVGKSSIINKLCPKQELRIGATSDKSGQGKQTTTVAHAYLDPENSNRIFVDLPGIQNFGTSHLSKEELILGFPEIRKLSALCKFNDCRHINEPNCEVKKALENSEIDNKRFNSFQTMYKEIESITNY